MTVSLYDDIEDATPILREVKAELGACRFDTENPSVNAKDRDCVAGMPHLIQHACR